MKCQCCQRVEETLGRKGLERKKGYGNLENRKQTAKRQRSKISPLALPWPTLFRRLCGPWGLLAEARWCGGVGRLADRRHQPARGVLLPLALAHCLRVRCVLLVFVCFNAPPLPFIF
jgi:hypothetical protein